MTLKCPIFAFSFVEDVACPTIDCVYRTKNDTDAVSSCAKMSMQEGSTLLDVVPFPVLEAFAQSKNIQSQRTASIQLLSLAMKVIFILGSDSMSDYTPSDICKCGIYNEGCENSRVGNKCSNRALWIDWVLDYVLNGVNGHSFSRFPKNVLRKIVLDVVTLQKQEIGNPALVAHLYKSTKIKKDKADGKE